MLGIPQKFVYDTETLLKTLLDRSSPTVDLQATYLPQQEHI